MTGYTDPTIKDETSRILKDLDRAITEDSKQAREIVKTEFTELKRKVSKFELEKLDYINQIESDKKALITSIRSQHEGLKIAQSLSGENNPEIIKKFNELEKTLNRIRYSMMSKKINIDVNKVEISDNLQVFCNTKYGVPPGTQTIPPPNAAPQKFQQLKPESLDKPRTKSPSVEKLESIEDFIRFVHTFRTLSNKPTLASEIPIEIANEAKIYVKVDHKYTMANFYDIMLNTLKDGKLMKNVCVGFENLAKLCNCVYSDSHSDETKIIKVDGPFYQEGIHNNLSNTDDILRLLGYENRLQFWQFCKPANDKIFETQVERLFCELCILIQETTAIEKQIAKTSVLVYITQMSNKSGVQNLPAPGAKVIAKPDLVAKPKVEEARPFTPEDDEEQYAFSELLVAIDSLQTQDQKYTTSLAEAIPDEFLELAKKCIRLPVKKKYQLIEMYRLIRTNVLNHKQIGEIKLGLIGVFKYGICQYFDANLPEIQMLLYDKDPFHSLVSSKMINTEDIFLKLGYFHSSEGQGMELNAAAVDKTHLYDVSLICCEVLIAIQELTEFEKTDQNPLKYFDTKLENIAGPNTNPIEKSCIPETQNCREASHLPEPAPRTVQPFVPIPPQSQQLENIQHRGSGPIQTIPPHGSDPIHTNPPKQGSGPIHGTHGTPPMQAIPQSQGSGPIHGTHGTPPMQAIPQSQGSVQMKTNPLHGSELIKGIPPPQGSGQMANFPQSQSQGSGPIQNIPQSQLQGSDPIQNIPQPQGSPHIHNISYGSEQMTNLPKSQGPGQIQGIPPPQGLGQMPNIPQSQSQGSGPIQNIPQSQLQGSDPIHNISYGSEQMTNLPKSQGPGQIQGIPPPQGLGQMPNIPQSQSQGSGPIQNIPQSQLQGSDPIHNISYGSEQMTNLPKSQGPGQIQGIPPPQGLGQMPNIPQSQSQGTVPIQNMPPQQGSGPIQSIPQPQGSPQIHNISYGSEQMTNFPQSQAPIQNYLVSQQGNQKHNIQPHPSQSRNIPQGSGNNIPNIQSLQGNPKQNLPIPPGPGQIQSLPPHRSENNPLQQGVGQMPQRNVQQPNIPPPQSHGQFHSFEGQHPSLILFQAFEKLGETFSNFNLRSAIPTHLIDLARVCLPLSAKDKYSHDIVCELVLINLKENKTIVEIREGMEWLAKYCMCIHLRVSDLEVRTLKESGSLFFREIIPRINLTRNIFAYLGYEHHEADRAFYLNSEIFKNPGNLNKLIQTGCDCLLAMVDLTAYEDIGHAKFIEFFQQYTPNPTYENMPVEMPSQSRQYSEPQTENLPSKSAFTHQQGSMSVQPTQSYSPNQHINPNFSVAVQSQPQFSSVYDQNRSSFPESPYDQSATLRYYQPQQPQQQQQQQQQPPPPQQHTFQSPPSGQQPDLSQTWQCPHCTSFNSIKLSFCEVCYKTPDYRPETNAEIPPARPAMNAKYCANCNTQNRMQDLNCTVCGANLIHGTQ